jgi:hypothetical protein
MNRRHARLKFTSVLVLLAALVFGGTAQAQNHLWSLKVGGTGSDSGAAVAADNAGNSYVTGTIFGPVTFAPGVTLPGGMFVAKYNLAGTLVWARQVDTAFGLGIAFDSINGAIYVTGEFFGTAHFGPGVLLTAPAGNSGFFLARYDLAGNLVWAKGSAGTGYAGGRGVAVDLGGNPHVTGLFMGVVALSQGPSLVATGFSDLFVARYDQAGSVVWVKTAGGAGFDQDFGQAVAVDNSGNTYITGTFQRTVSFSPGVSLSTAGINNAFVAKYDATGSVLWAIRNGDDLTETGGSGIAVDGNGNSYVTGVLEPDNLLGGSSLLVKFDSSGNKVWSVGNVDAAISRVNGIAVDGNGNSYITGMFAGVVTLAGVGVLPVGLTSPVIDMFIASYDVDGNLLWGKQGFATFRAEGVGIAVSPDGVSTVTGHFHPNTVNFGGGLLTSAGFEDILVVQYGPAPDTSPTTHFAISTPFTAIPGVPFNFTVTALDQFNIVVPNYSGKVHFTSNDANATLPLNTQLTGGTGQFTATFAGQGFLTITATDTLLPSRTGTSNQVQTFVRGPATRFLVSLYPDVSTAGSMFDFEITALDAFGHIAVGYLGTVRFTSSDGSATLPANSTMTNGVKLFSAAILTPGLHSITATDTLNSTLTGSFQIDVAPAALTPMGANVSVQPVDFAGILQPISLTFSSVTASGGTNAVPVQMSGPANFMVNGVIYEITTTAQYTPPVTVCFTGGFTLSDVMMHFENGSWVTLANQQYFPAGPGPYNKICADTSSLSPFAVTRPIAITPTLSWSQPANMTFGSALGSGQLNATANVPGTFVYSPAAGTVLPVGSGQVLSAAFTPNDSVHYTAASVTTLISVVPAPPSAANLVVTRVLTRSGVNIVVRLTITNNGGTAAANVTLSSLKIGSTSGSPLPQALGTIASGASVQATVTVPGSVGTSGAASSLTLGGTYSGGSFSSTARITLP